MKPRILLDEDTHLALAEALRQRGFDAVHIQEIGRKGCSDPEQLDFAVQNERCIVSFNRKDFVALHKTNGITVSLYNLSDYDFDVAGHAREGQIFEALPTKSSGRLATPVRLANAAGSIACAGAFSSTGNRAFWLLSNPGTSKLLFVGFSLPASMLVDSNDANACWIPSTYATDSFINNGAGADDLFDQLFNPTSQPRSLNPDLRVRALTQITPVGSRTGLDDPHDMFVVLASY